MKKELEKIARDFGCSCSYSGRKKTMFVVGDNAPQAVSAMMHYIKHHYPHAGTTIKDDTYARKAA